MRARQPLSFNLRTHGRWFATIVALLLCLYVVSYSGVFRADDEHILASRAISLTLRGEWEEPQVFGNSRVQTLRQFGDSAIQIEPAQTVTGAALVSLAKAAELGHVQALFSLNAYLTALTAGIVFLTVLALHYRLKVAIWCAVLFGVATMAWPYATTLYRDVLAMFLSALAFLGLSLIFTGGQKARYLGGILIAIGLLGGILAKNTVLALLPAFATVLGIEWYRRDKQSISRRSILLIAAVATAGIAVALVAIPSTGPLARFSSSYYGFLVDHFRESIQPGLILALAGPFVSPTESLLLFSPTLVLAILGIRRGMKNHDWFVISAISFTLWLALAQGLFYRELWAGAVGWGLRYMLPALPPLMVMAAPAIEQLIQNRSFIARLAFIGLLVIGVLIQISGVLVDWGSIYRDWRIKGLDPFSANAVWDPQFLAIPPHLRKLLQPQEWTTAWSRSISDSPNEALLIPLLAIGVAAIILLMQRRSDRSRAAIATRSKILNIAIAIAIALPSLPLWWLYQRDPYWGRNRDGFNEAIAWINHSISDDDVLVIDAYGTQLWSFWMNNWRRNEAWYSLAFEIPAIDDADPTRQFASDLTVSLFRSLEKIHSRLYYVDSVDSPRFGLHLEADWLDRQFPSHTHQRFGANSAEVTVRIYDLRTPNLSDQG